MLGPGQLQLPHNAMTKLGQDVVHFSHPPPFPFFISFMNEARRYPFSSLAVRRSMKVSTSSTMSLSVAMEALPRHLSLAACGSYRS